MIEERGAYLAGSTYWIPSFGDEYITYDLTSSSPKGWRVVSQGKRLESKDENGRHIDSWSVTTPTEEIYLIGAKFSEYSLDVGAVKAMAFLRSDDESLANKYLETTAQYMEMYRTLLGPYPYSKFALVENFWETGYGMPSFTLLGEQIIRFPFILHSSYPHELLHNWWGNSVYIDFESGNWAEGLTAYMADHLIAEQRGIASEYRRSTLQNYTDYVDEKSDFPLNEFISRFSPASSAVGYGKSAMMWDMLREKVGDVNFTKAFQRFYRNNKFKRTGYSDIKAAFEATSGLELTAFFDQWLQRTGAPELQLNSVKVSGKKGAFKLDFILNQLQDSEPFTLAIPVAVYSENAVTIHKVAMNNLQQSYSLELKDKPTQINVDPQFNLFRKLHFSEIPPSLSKIFGAEKVMIILPSKATSEEVARYETLTNIWAKQTEKFSIVKDTDIDTLPSDRAVWIFGWNNKFRTIVENGLKSYGGEIATKDVTLGKTKLLKADNSFVVGVRHPDNSNLVAVWLTAHADDAVAGLARKLPHYGKYSYLAFTGTEPSNVAKGQWPTVNSPLITKLSDDFDSSKNPLVKRPALAKLAPVFSAERMQQTIEHLASDEMKGRGLGSTELDVAADYIAEQFKQAGLLPAGDNGTYFQDFVVKAGKNKKKVITRNVLAVIQGSNKQWTEESVIISAHYDHLGLGWPDVTKKNEGKIHNGADDNASGVAVLIEMALTLKNMKPKRSIIFAAFSAEEAGLLGSKYYVNNMQKYPAKKAIGIINMDTVGGLGEKKLLVLNGDSASEWKFIFMGTSFVTGIETEMVTQEINSSDQVPFVAAGIPGIQLFAGSSVNYHKPGDTADKIDISGLVKVATVAREVVRYLAERPEPMTFKGAKVDKNDAVEKPTRVGRKVTTGVMPDFAFNGKGVKVASVSAGSPAAKAGINKGDVIIQLAGVKVSDLRSYSTELKKHGIGDRIEVIYIRNGTSHTTTLTLAAR
ncbi:MAG: peptidase M28 [Gammaproteobacteria bacterium]|nr:MAG: peptidase M28 [Gammaproteobacteria bacterium]